MTTKKLRITSPAFSTGDRMDDRFSKEQDNDQPALQISGVPEDAVELAIICHDPDAPRPDGFTHWLLYGLPPNNTEVAENAGDDRFRPAENDFGTIGYGGPRPPVGHGRHHYYFWVYALDIQVNGTPRRREFLDRYGDHVLEQNRLVGVYER